MGPRLASPSCESVNLHHVCFHCFEHLAPAVFCCSAGSFPRLSRALLGRDRMTARSTKASWQLSRTCYRGILQLLRLRFRAAKPHGFGSIVYADGYAAGVRKDDRLGILSRPTSRVRKQKHYGKWFEVIIMMIRERERSKRLKEPVAALACFLHRQSSFHLHCRAGLKSHELVCVFVLLHPRVVKYCDFVLFL